MEAPIIHKNIRVDMKLWETVKAEAATKGITLTRYLHDILINRNN